MSDWVPIRSWQLAFALGCYLLGGMVAWAFGYTVGVAHGKRVCGCDTQPKEKQ